MKRHILLFLFLVKIAGLHAQDVAQVIKAKPLTLSGGLSLRGIYTNNTGAYYLKNNPYDGLLSGNITASIFSIEVPVSFMYSPTASSYQQPFNQYGMSPRYKWLTLHLGYRNLNYNSFTLAGHTMYGIGFDIKPGKFKAGMFYGRLSKSTVIDTFSQSLQPYSFSRKGFAAHIGYGSNKTFIAFSGITASDDGNNVDADINYLSRKYGQTIAPAGNLVLGGTGRLAISKRLYAETEGAFSIYTRDLRNTTHLMLGNDSGMNNFIQKRLIRLNLSSEYYTAITSAIGYNHNHWQLKLRYQRIAPEFKSMGAYFINNDIENITIAPSFNLFKSKLQVSGSVGLQHDNLNHKKASQSERVISSLSFTYLFSPRFILSGNYNNYAVSTKQNTTITRIADTLRITQSTQNLSLTPVYSLIKERTVENYVLSVNANKLNDFNNSYTAGDAARELNSYLIFFNYKITIKARSLGLQSGLTYTNISGLGLNTQNYGITAGTDKKWKKDKYTTGIIASYLLGEQASARTHTLIISVNTGLQLSKSQSLSLNAYFNQTAYTGTTTVNGIANSRIELAYSYLFNPKN